MISRTVICEDRCKLQVASYRLPTLQPSTYWLDPARNAADRRQKTSFEGGTPTRSQSNLQPLTSTFNLELSTCNLQPSTFNHHHARAYRPLRTSAPASITPWSCLNIMIVGAAGLPYAAWLCTMWPRDLSCAAAPSAIRPSRFNMPGLKR